MHRIERQIMHRAKRQKQERKWLSVYPPILSQKISAECDNSEVERIFAVNQDAENLYVYLHNHIKATRPMVYFGTPTI